MARFLRPPAIHLPLLLCGFLHAPLTSAQTSPSTTPKGPVASAAPQTQAGQQSTVASPAAVALSPDGTLVAWTMRGKAGTSIHLTPAQEGSSPERQITVPNATGCSYADPIWSPDGATLAFLGSCVPDSTDPTVPKQAQMYLWSKADGSVRQLTHVKGDINQPAWSPDGKAIAFLFVENATRTAGALDAMKPFAGVIGEDGVEVQGIYVVSAASGHGEMWTEPKQHVYEFTWDPDKSRPVLAWIAAPPPGENNWWTAKLYMQSMGMGLERIEDFPNGMKDGAPPSPVVTVVDPKTVAGPLHGLQIAVPRISPDGEQIAFIGGLMSDQGSTGGDLYVVKTRGGVPTDVTPKIDGTPSYEGWQGNDTLGFVEDRRGHTLLSSYRVSTKSVVPGAPVDLGEVSVSGGVVKDAISVSEQGTFAMVKQGFSAPPEIWAGSAAHLVQITRLNAKAKPAARTESVEWTNGPFHVQGWLTFPANYDPAKRYPIIVSVHGGPSASITARYSGSGMLFPDHGYFELQANPRGSFGQGEAFTQANRKDFGYGDLKDIEAGLDYVEAKYPIDHNREGVTGWSYGGFMTMFSVTQTHRFKAAVAGAGLSDWLSYYGENSIDQWMIPFFGASVYDDPAVYAKSSAMTFIKNVQTPTLVIVGDRDGECPAPQSFEFWHALRDLGVKTQLVVYPNEGHGFRDPEHIRDRDQRSLRWFDEFLK